MIGDDKVMKCNGKKKADWPSDDKFEVGGLEAGPQVIITSNNAQSPKELALDVTTSNADKHEVGTRVTMMAKSTDENDKRNKWIVTKHHIGLKDWFTLKNEAYGGYFLTCPEKRQPGQTKPEQLIVSYEVPGIQMTSFQSHNASYTVRAPL